MKDILFGDERKKRRILPFNMDWRVKFVVYGVLLFFVEKSNTILLNLGTQIYTD